MHLDITADQTFSNSVRNPVQMKRISNAGKIYAHTHTMLRESQTATPPQRVRSASDRNPGATLVLQQKD